jgi:hypothetical protein
MLPFSRRAVDRGKLFGIWLARTGRFPQLAHP